MKFYQTVVLAAAVGIAAGAGGRMLGMMHNVQTMQELRAIKQAYQSQKPAEYHPMSVHCRFADPTINPGYTLYIVFDAKNRRITYRSNTQPSTTVTIKDQAVVMKRIGEAAENTYVSTIMADNRGYTWTIAANGASNIVSLLKEGNSVSAKFACEE